MLSPAATSVAPERGLILAECTALLAELRHEFNGDPRLNMIGLHGWPWNANGSCRTPIEATFLVGDSTALLLLPTSPSMAARLYPCVARRGSPHQADLVGGHHLMDFRPVQRSTTSTSKASRSSAM